jgi:hypothetical protein
VTRPRIDPLWPTLAAVAIVTAATVALIVGVAR